MPELDSEAIDFRAASESFAAFRKLARRDLETLRLVADHQGRKVPTVGGIIFRALSVRVASRWKFVSFRGAEKGEWRGVVDVVAIRKSTAQPGGELLKRGDLFHIILVQIKASRRAHYLQHSHAARPPSVP